MKKGQSFFSKVGTLAERDNVFRNLEAKSPTLYIFDGQLNRVVFSIDSFRDGKVVCNLEQGEPNCDREKVTINFSIKDTQYFIKGTCEEMKPGNLGRFQFDLSGDLYKLQRRANFRVRVPFDRSFLFDFLEIDGEAVQQRYEVFDLSAGGMALMIPEDRVLMMKPEQTFAGELKIPDQSNIEISGKLCYQRPAKGLDGYSKIAGFQFLDLSPKKEQHILSLVMEIYRGLFSG